MLYYYDTITTEHIAICPMSDTGYVNEECVDFIEFTKYGDDLVFSVSTYVDGEEWFWKFDMEVISDYERVKAAVLTNISNCNTMKELVIELDKLFNNNFEGILIESNFHEKNKFRNNDECESENVCDGCNECHNVLYIFRNK